LFALYINDLIDDVKKSTYGIHIGSVFMGCILYHADDILLLSVSCTGLQHMVDICAKYGRTWDICFNSSKSYCVTFGHRRTGQFFLGGAESILPEKSGAIWQFFGPNNCQIAIKNHFARPWGAATPPPAHTPLPLVAFALLQHQLG